MLRSKTTNALDVLDHFEMEHPFLPEVDIMFHSTRRALIPCFSGVNCVVAMIRCFDNKSPLWESACLDCCHGRRAVYEASPCARSLYENSGAAGAGETCLPGQKELCLTLYWIISSIGSTHKLSRPMAGLKIATPHCNEGGNGGMACVGTTFEWRERKLRLAGTRGRK